MFLIHSSLMIQDAVSFGLNKVLAVFASRKRKINDDFSMNADQNTIDHHKTTISEVILNEVDNKIEENDSISKKITFTAAKASQYTRIGEKIMQCDSLEACKAVMHLYDVYDYASAMDILQQPAKRGRPKKHSPALQRT